MHGGYKLYAIRLLSPIHNQCLRHFSPSATRHVACSIFSLKFYLESRLIAPSVFLDAPLPPRNPQLLYDSVIRHMRHFHPLHQLMNSIQDMSQEGTGEWFVQRNVSDGYNQGFPNNVARLRTAASIGLINVVQLLLQQGVDADAQDKDGLTPLALAAANGHEAVARLLLEHG
ncbi:uncharacterized protein K441DRAFT_635992, partial [Cenococcum geophilum 1.58]|uniref:uncharacterized protein n=1 Tax=Cenococcum geophilum 1.58 TaxID=794803 RepID=UPI00358DE18A